MASNTGIPCGPCKYESITSSAIRWCIQCEEGFCRDCEKNHRSLKLTRDHKMIAVEDYLKIQDVSVDLTCMAHGKKLDLFCKYHSVAICAVCLPSAHKACRADDIISIDDAAKNVKRSTALADLEETISKTLENVRQFIKNRTSALTNIDTDGQTIKERILETRLKLNKHLDALQEKLLQELRINHENCRLKHKKTMKRLNQTQKEFEKLKDQTKQLKLFASDLQMFLGTCNMNKTVMEKIKLLKVEISKEKSYTMEMKLHPVVKSLVTDAKQFGEIHITEVSAEMQFRDAKSDQAQIQVWGSMQNIQDTNVQLKLKFDIKPKTSYQITGCLMLSDGKVLIADYWGTGKLMKYDDTGNFIRDVQALGRPFDLTEMDKNHIAVTYPDTNCLEVMNIKRYENSKKIVCSNSCYGISHTNGKIIIVVKERGILIMDIAGTILDTIYVDTSSISYLTANEDKIYYTDGSMNTVYCCNYEGRRIWRFTNKLIEFPEGITVDDNQNVYVVGSVSNSVIVIQHDGQKCKEILNTTDRLHIPYALSYNNKTKLLLLGYRAGSMALYHVS